MFSCMSKDALMHREGLEGFNLRVDLGHFGTF